MRFSASLQCAWLALAIIGRSGGTSSPADRGSDASATSGAANGAAPGSEKVLNVYNWTDYIEPSVIAAFQQEYGIKVNYDVYDSNEQLETKLLVGHSNYDVVVSGGFFFERQIKAGL